jgi:sialidase-1
VIGTFRTNVYIDLDDPEMDRIRFTCTSPAKSGLLIDDVVLVPATPQRIVGVRVDPITLPILTGISASPLLRIRIDVEGSLDPLSLTSLTAACDAPTDLKDLESLHVFLTGARATLSAAGGPNCFADARRLGDAQQPRRQVLFDGAVPLEPGANYVWVAATLDRGANLDHEVQVTCSQVAFSDGTSCKPQSANPPGTQRIGVALRRRGDDRSHTFRIPGLATTNQGTLIGVYDIRRRSGGDLPGDIDVGMSRSTDGGRTWESMRTIMDMGNDPNWNYDGIGDPAVLVDRNTGTIWVAATWSHGNRSWVGSGPGLEPEETGQLMLVSSDNDGKTWSRPVNITQQVKRPEWCFLLQGPGTGITMRDGTIVFAAQYQDPVANRRLPHSTIIYSRDHGKTWQVGTGAFDDTTEAQVVEIEPGELMLNCRYNRASTRVVATTRDMGATWDVHATSRRSLIEPRSCMASLINVDRQQGKELGGWLLFSNPDSTQARERITIKASRDKGLTWPKEFRLLLDEGRGAGYSCMTMIDETTVGILYEGSLAQLVFQRVKLRDIIGSTEPPPANPQPAVNFFNQHGLPTSPFQATADPVVRSRERSS